MIVCRYLKWKTFWRTPWYVTPQKAEEYVRLQQSLSTWERALVVSLFSQDANAEASASIVAAATSPRDSQLFEAVLRYECRATKRSQRCGKASSHIPVWRCNVLLFSISSSFAARAEGRIGLCYRRTALQLELRHLESVLRPLCLSMAVKKFHAPPLFGARAVDSSPTHRWSPLQAHYTNLKAAPNSQTRLTSLRPEQGQRCVLFGLSKDHLLCQVTYSDEDYVHAVSVWDVAQLKLLGPSPTVHQYLAASVSEEDRIANVSPARWDGPLLFVTCLNGKIRIVDFTQLKGGQEWMNQQVEPPTVLPLAIDQSRQTSFSAQATSVLLSYSNRYLCICRGFGLLEIHDLVWPISREAITYILLPPELGAPKALCDGPPGDSGNWVSILTEVGCLVTCSLDTGVVLSYLRPYLSSTSADSTWFPVTICPVPLSFLASTNRRQPFALVGFANSVTEESVAMINLLTGSAILLLIPSSVSSTDTAVEKCSLHSSMSPPNDSEIQCLVRLHTQARIAGSFGSIVIWTTARERCTLHDEPACIVTAFSDGHIRVWTLSDPTAVGMISEAATNITGESGREISVAWTRFRQTQCLCLSFAPSHGASETAEGGVASAESSCLTYVTQDVSGVSIIEERCGAQEDVLDRWEARHVDGSVSFVSEPMMVGARQSLPPSMPVCDMVFLHPVQDGGVEDGTALLPSEIALLAVACHDGSVRLYV